jgi:multidrug efflux pump subunit AcrA (membrane-fusion protein)
MLIIQKLKRKHQIILLSIIVLLVIGLFALPRATHPQKKARVEQQPFNIEVAADGEVQALKYESINVPDLLNRRELKIWYLKITNLVAEGTHVKKGDFIATLDPADVEDRMKQAYEEIDKLENSLETAVIDSAINLAEKRDLIVNAYDELEESKIKLEQSRYESKAMQRQAQIQLHKAQLELNAEKRDYEKEKQKQKTKTDRIQKKLNEETKIKDLLEELKKQLNITSPSEGMVVYGKNWRGNKIKVNDEVGPWMPIIATIPDLNSLISEAVVKEIDIAKIKIGQLVNITIDAFPDDIFKGEIIKVANIGQPIKNAGMNGFKVTITLDKKGKKVLPSMTTNNQIEIVSYPDALVVPREAVFGKDSDKYVFKISGRKIEKTIIETGGENETHIRVLKGLKTGDEVLLSRPEEEEEDI